MTDAYGMVVEAVRRHALGGVAVALVRKGKPTEYLCVGLADRDRHSPITTDTVFRIASISKTLTSIGLLQLRDAGHFSLDDPVNQYLTAFQLVPPPGGPDITFRHLLTHTAGIGELPRVADAVRREVWGMGRPGTSAADLRSVYRGAFHTEVPAGSKWAYANHGFAVLGQLVEEISGQPFAEYMREKVLDPLHMATTEYRRTERTDGHVATGYHWVLGKFRGMRDYDLQLQGPGSVLSDVTDMAGYAAWLAGAGPARRGVLKASTLAEMMSPQFSLDPRLPGMGLAFFRSTQGAHRVVGHDGNVPGFASAMLVAPDDGMGVVVLTNTATLAGAHRLAASLLQSMLGLPDPADGLEETTVIDQPHLWGDLVGDYAPSPGFLTNVRQWQMLGGEVQVVLQKRHLTLRALSPVRQLRQGVPLYRTDDDDPLSFAAVLDGMFVRVLFQRSAEGSVDRVVIGGPVNAVLHRRPPWRSSRLRLRIGAAALGLHSVRRWRRGRS